MNNGEEEYSLSTTGFKPLEPLFLFEVDTPKKIRIKKVIIKLLIQLGFPSRLYETKHGFHIIIKINEWEEVEEMRDFFNEYNDHYFNINPRESVLRISAKLDKYARIISPAPRLCWNSHEDNGDLRIVKREIIMYRCKD